MQTKSLTSNRSISNSETLLIVVVRAPHNCHFSHIISEFLRYGQIWHPWKPSVVPPRAITRMTNVSQRKMDQRRCFETALAPPHLHIQSNFVTTCLEEVAFGRSLCHPRRGPQINKNQQGLHKIPLRLWDSFVISTQIVRFSKTLFFLRRTKNVRRVSITESRYNFLFSSVIPTFLNKFRFRSWGRYVVDRFGRCELVHKATFTFGQNVTAVRFDVNKHH